MIMLDVLLIGGAAVAGGLDQADHASSRRDRHRSRGQRRLFCQIIAPPPRSYRIAYPYTDLPPRLL